MNGQAGGSRLSHEAMGRVAVSCAVAVISSITLMGICQNPVKAIFWWFLYTMAAGIFLNTRRGEPHRFLLMASLPAAIVPILAIVFSSVILGSEICFSGTTSTNPRFLMLLAFFVIISWLAVYLFSYTRNIVLPIVRAAAKGAAATKIQKIDTAVRALVSLIISAALLYRNLVGP